jgi:hypothetical protein
MEGFSKLDVPNECSYIKRNETRFMKSVHKVNTEQCKLLKPRFITAFMKRGFKRHRKLVSLVCIALLQRLLRVTYPCCSITDEDELLPCTDWTTRGFSFQMMEPFDSWRIVINSIMK